MQIHGSMPEVFPGANDYDVSHLSPQHRWWLRHKRDGHRVDWPHGGSPLCYSCGLLGTEEAAQQADAQAESEEG